jgi:hypothetical protein
MPRKKHSAEPIVAMLRQIEVRISQPEKHRPSLQRSRYRRADLTTAGEKSTAG